MRVGVHLVSFDLAEGPALIGPMLAETGRAAEEAGVASLSVMDHFFQMEGMGLGEASVRCWRPTRPSDSSLRRPPLSSCRPW